MLKRIISVLLCCALLSTGALAVAGTPLISAPSAVLFEKSTGTLLFEQNAHERLAPASVTKVMTLLLIMEALEDGRIALDDVVTASSYAASMGGSQIYLEENERMQLEEMLKSVVVSSANDCAVALAEHISGSETAFVALMNERAAQLGMNDTNFVNCTGLDDSDSAGEHLTSAYDIALMSMELLKHEQIKDYTTIWMDSVRDGSFGLSNTNKLVRYYDGATGLKTGFTAKARYCLSASAERNGMELVAVVMNAPSSAERFDSARGLLDFGFANYALVDAAPETPFEAQPVSLGVEDSVSAVLEDGGSLLVEKSQRGSVERSAVFFGELEAPVGQGEQLGELTVSVDGELLATIPIVAGEDVERLSFWQMTGRLMMKMFMV